MGATGCGKRRLGLGCVLLNWVTERWVVNDLFSLAPRHAGRWCRWGARMGLCLAVAWGALLLTAGCSLTLESQAIQTSFPPHVLVDPLPLAVGVYYSPEFRSYESSGGLNFALGEASIALFDRVFARMFNQAVRLESRPPLHRGTPSVMAVIEPQIESFDAKLGSSVGVTYRMRLSTTQGGEIATWTVSGVGGQIDWWAGSAKIQDATASALRSAAARFVMGFRDQPDVRKWLSARGLIFPGP